MPRITFKETDGLRLRNFIIAGSRWVAHYKDYLDEINYYPVPDADTGANMYITFVSVCNELSHVDNQRSAGAIARAAALGGLIGSKGNSGIILAQFFRGFAESVGDKEILVAEDIARAFMAAAQTAKEGISNPRDGTILSVAFDGAAAALKKAGESDFVGDILAAYLEEAYISLEKTGKILPELKKAGVVDAGAQGLVYYFEGMYRLATGKSLKAFTPAKMKKKMQVDAESLKYQYCTSFMIKKHLDTDDKLFKKMLCHMGDQVIIDKGMDSVSKIHIHTNNPDLVIEKAAVFGFIDNIVIDDMKRQVVER